METVVVLDELGEGALQQKVDVRITSQQGEAKPQRGRLTWMMLVPFLKLVKDLMTS